MAPNYQGIRFYNPLFITFASLFCFLYQTFTHKESFALQYFESTGICFLQKLFLTDYLNGDTYYKTAYPEHNLVRTKAQLALLHSIDAHLDEMKQYIDNYKL